MIPKVQLVEAVPIGLEAKLVKSTCTILKDCFRQIIHLERDESLEIWDQSRNVEIQTFIGSLAEKFSGDAALLHLKKL